TELQRNPQQLRASLEERQIEAVQVVVLEDVRIELHDAPHETPDQIRLRRVVVRGDLQGLRVARGGAQRDQEDAIEFGIEPRGFEVELGAPQVVESETLEVRSSRRAEVLILRRQRHHGLRKVAEAAQRSTEAPRRAV